MADSDNVIRPIEGKKNVLITSALPYVNNVPHLGNIIGSTLSADCFSRYSKQRGNPTLYICGTDEYGTATETKALEEGVTPRELCDKFHKLHKQIYDDFQINFDYFGRTSTDNHTKIVQEMFLRLWENKFLDERVTTQPYCETHGAFLADRFVEGTCPRCGYDDARGDQCDQCGNLLDPFELINPRCKVCKVNQPPVPRDTKHVFLALDRLQPQMDEWFAKASKEGKWSPNAIAITKSWLDKGLEGRSITRDLKWGVPVPLPGYEGKVIYVWFDACIGYPSITSCYSEKYWEEWWKTGDVKLYQFMGKDNTPFHAVTFPSSQLGTGDKWNMVYNISTTEYLNYENTKFSKSRSVGVFGDQAKDTGIPTSVFRYYLLSSRPESSDTQFEWSSFVQANNSILLANIGNFVNRIVKFVNAKFDGVVPEYSTSIKDESFDFAAWVGDVQKLLDEYILDMDAVHLRSGVEKATAVSSQGNTLLQYRLDNASLEKEPERTKAVIGYALSLCGLLASILSPFTPSTSDSIAEQLNVPLPLIPDTFDPGFIKPGHKIGKAAYLFSRIDEKKVAEWKEKFGGTSETREAEAAAKAKKQADKDKRKAKKAASKAAEAAKQDGEAKPVDAATVATGEAKELPVREKPVEK
ncbi:methionyl-tRNA synthetase [Sporothrix schenckii 1099-18]|uniref:methionine--tRNA ligase n=2 Tax=Sporothrix schenckii TaxID=29908 RepID=U7PVC9_SPOS1|nr:methionyl-tRNA synthetase [Sporothrix schenckii 1099-18]ERS98719.1 methionine-tRNA ligase [Sporothrix schenckii ATCC 58251]KJR89091.1 methionyl-tRNA synthetase [Sporothrix schenckii 1099-18]